MFLARCPFCSHSNPPGARFCNECGSPLHLRPCDHCEAVNDVLSSACYRCGAPLRVERQRETTEALTFANVRDSATEREASTVAVAYGEDGSSSKRSIPPRPVAAEEIDRAAQPMRDDAATQEAVAASGREPFRETFAPDNADRVANRRVHDSARRLLTFVAGVAIVGLAALGSDTFLERGAAPVEAPPSSAAPTPATEEVPASPDTPTARDPALREATPDDADGSGPAAAPKPEKKPAPSPKASQDAIETQRIITRELGGFAPPSTR